MPVIKGNTSFYNYELFDHVSYNIKGMLDYGLLELGAYTNVGLSSPYSTLQHSGSGIYEGLNEWIWESGVSPIVSQSAPFQVSGVYVNNQYFPLGATLPNSTTYYVDYLHGRVVFNKDLPTSSGVKCEYSTRDVSVYLVDSPQWRTIVDSFVENYTNLGVLYPSGMAKKMKENRVWLPCLVVDVQSNKPKGFQLGGGETHNVNVQFHGFSDRPFSNKRIADILNNQFEKTFVMYNSNTIPRVYNFNGSLTGSGVTYPYLANRDAGWFWTFAHIDLTTGGPILTEPYLYRSESTWKVSVERYGSTLF